MSATIELFELFKQHLNVHSDHAAGQILGVKPQTVSNWRTRGSQAEPKLIETMCHKMGQDPVPWLLRAQADQAHDPANVLVWKRLASRLGVALTAVTLFLGGGNEAAAQAVAAMDSLNGAALGVAGVLGQALNLLPLAVF